MDIPAGPSGNSGRRGRDEGEPHEAHELTELERQQRTRRERYENLDQRENEEIREIRERYAAQRLRHEKLDRIDDLEAIQRRERQQLQPANVQLVSKIWTQNIWETEANASYRLLCLTYPAIFGKPSVRKVRDGLAEYCFIVNVSDDFVRLHCVDGSVDAIRWFLYIDRILYINTDLEPYGLENFHEYGYHLIVDQNYRLKCVYLNENIETHEKTIGEPIAINVVIPFCRNGQTCYAMHIFISKNQDGLRYWWVIGDDERTRGYYEMFGSTEPDSYFEQTRKYISYPAPKNLRISGLLLHSDAKLLMRDWTGHPWNLWCNTLFQCGTFITFDRLLIIYIENERKLVTLQQLVDCGAIANIYKYPYTLLMLQQIRSQTCSSIWALNIDIFDDRDNTRRKRVRFADDEQRAILRIPDRNAISNMWYWGRGRGFDYIYWYQNTRDWTRKFEFDTQQFRQPFPDIEKPTNAPRKLWTGNDPQNWVLN